MQHNDKGSTFSRFLTGTFFTGIGKVSTITLGLVTFILSVRFLAAEELGAFVLLNSIVVFVNGFADLGVNAATTRFTAGLTEEVERRRLINSAIYFRIACVAIFSAITLLGQDLLYRLFGLSLPSHLIKFIPLLVACDSLTAILSAYMAGEFKFKQVGSLDLVNTVAGLLGLLIFVVWKDYGLMGRIYARMMASGFSLLFAVMTAQVSHRLEFDTDVMKRMIRFGFPLNLNHIFNTLFTRVDTFLIGALLGPAEIAMYEIARKIPDSISMLYDAFHKVYYPIVSNLFAMKKTRQQTEIINHANRLFGFLNSFGSLIAFLFGGAILTWLFSEGYGVSATAFGILMISLGFLAINTNMGYSMSAAGDTMKPFLINIAPTIVSLVGYVILIPVSALPEQQSRQQLAW